MKLPFPLAALCLLAWASSATAELSRPENTVDRDLGRNLAATCANCHGTNGQTQEVPGSGLAPLAGVPEAVTLRKLADFRNGERPASIMHQIARGYSDAQLALIVAYFAAQRQDTGSKQ